MHNVSAKCAKLTRSKADWRMIGIDYEDDIEVVENRRVKIEEMEEVHQTGRLYQDEVSAIQVD